MPCFCLQEKWNIKPEAFCVSNTSATASAKISLYICIRMILSRERGSNACMGASFLIKKECCRCGPHPLQVTSSRARPPLVKGAGHIGPLFPEFRGWPLWFMASIALRGPQYLAPEVVPGASLHSEALSPECGRECQETGDCGPTRHVGAGRWGLLGPTAHGLLGRRHPGPRLSNMVG